MKLNIFNTKLFILGIALTSLTACVDDDIQGQDAQFGTKPVATTADTSITVTEGANDGSGITFTIDNPVNAIAYFKIEVMGGTATEDVDYIAGTGDTRGEIGTPGEGFEMRVPALAESFTIPVNAFTDIYAEGSETVTLKISAAGTRTILTQDGGVLVDVTINDFQSNFCGMVLAWDGPASDTLCDVDFDVFLSDFGAYAFTANCPEVLVEPVDPNSLFTTELPDGTRDIVIDLFALNGAEAGVDIPLRLDIGKVGVVTANFDLSGIFTTDDDPQTIVVGTIEVVNGAYTIRDNDGNVLAQE